MASSSAIPTKDRPDPVLKSDSQTTEDPFSVLPDPFDLNRFQPPIWAREMSSFSESNTPVTDKDGDDGEDDNESLGLSEQSTVWEDARDEVDDILDKSGEFKLAELKVSP